MPKSKKYNYENKYQGNKKVFVTLTDTNGRIKINLKYDYKLHGPEPESLPMPKSLLKNT